MKIVTIDDAVSRQWLMRKATEMFYTTNYFNHITKMIEEAPSVNPQPCEDAISRQAVQEQMIKYGFHAPNMTVTEFVEDLPSVNPQEPKWIPVSERLPEEKQEKYLCTFDDGSIGMDWYEHCKSKWRWHSKTYRGYGTNVVAWMPLPKPYKAESEDKE